MLNQEYLHPTVGSRAHDNLSEDDISGKFVTPTIVKVGWDEATQIRRQASFTEGRIIAPGMQVQNRRTVYLKGVARAAPDTAPGPQSE